MKYISVENITKTFSLSKKQAKIERSKDKKNTAVRNLSFKLQRSEIYSLLGPNGAGKTTALRCIVGLITPDRGDVLIDGVSIAKRNLKAISNIAFLTGELKLDESLTPNYLFDFFSKLHGLDHKASKERKEKLFNRFGISKFQEVKVANLSTGMKQKISIVISLVHDPDYIIFDEPTNGLDITTSKEIIDYLLEMREQGKGILISTHIMSLAQKISDRIGIILNGEKVVEGSIDKFKEESGIEDFDLEKFFFKLLDKHNNKEGK